MVPIVHAPFHNFPLGLYLLCSAAHENAGREGTAKLILNKEISNAAFQWDLCINTIEETLNNLGLQIPLSLCN